MRTYRSLGIVGLSVALGLVGLSVTLQLEAQGPSLQVAPEGGKMLEAFADATKPGAPAAALNTWARTYNATVSTLTPDTTTVKAALALLSGDTTAQDPPQDVVQEKANCKDKCPDDAWGNYKTRFGVVVHYNCTGVEGCSFDQQLKKWRCSYKSCWFRKSATVIPQ